MTQPIIIAERLHLREFNLDDAAFIQKLLNDPGWLEFIGDRQMDSPEKAEQYIQNGLFSHYQTHGFGLWAIERQADQVLVGMCGLLKREALIHIDLGFALLSAYQKQGYAHEAAQACLNYAHNTLAAKTVAALTLPHNQACIQLLTKLGFRYFQPIHWGEPPQVMAYYEYHLP